MWREIERESRRFDTAVLSTVSETGPISVRCVPSAAHDLGVLMIDDPGDSVPGPASVLYHRHDERLWKLRSCLITGRLEHEDGEWQFIPERFIPGMGIGGLLSYVRFLRRGRSRAARYLQWRNLPRPAVRWDEIGSLLAIAAAGARNVSGTDEP
ncbi:MAG: hypothetical protein WB239_15625 [Acidimicrobiia bacterium]